MLQWGDLCASFLREAIWFASRELPSSEQYLKNGIISAGVPVILMHAFFLLGRGINKTSMDALNDIPSIVCSAASIVRLWNDVGTDKVFFTFACAILTDEFLVTLFSNKLL